MGMERKVLIIDGMTCINCQNKIEQELKNTAGISKVQVSYSKVQAEIEFNPEIVTLNRIAAIIEKLDYTVIDKKQFIIIFRQHRFQFFDNRLTDGNHVFFFIIAWHHHTDLFHNILPLYHWIVSDIPSEKAQQLVYPVSSRSFAVSAQRYITCLSPYGILPKPSSASGLI